MSDDPVGVLATGTGGYGAVQALRRALPHEDIVLVCDHAYAPYPRRPPRVVLDRIGRLADELAERPVKLLLVASAAATDEGLAFLQARLAPLPVIGMEATLSAAGRLTPGGVVLAVAGEGCLRSLPFWQATRRVRGPAGIAVAEWPGLRELVEQGRAESREAAALAREQLSTLGPEVTALALVCPHSAALRSLIEQALPSGAVIVDGIGLAVERVRRLLATSRLQAHRRRPGQSIVMSTDPNRANGLAVAMRG
ncbi:MAG: glutamate racemase [Gaiellales bacterium]|jgi:glutamate racemase|nr:glutamate racemase [Gaiellales bacterium]